MGNRDLAPVPPEASVNPGSHSRKATAGTNVRPTQESDTMGLKRHPLTLKAGGRRARNLALVAFATTAVLGPWTAMRALADVCTTSVGALERCASNVAFS